ncbi:hypothetical protein AAE478_000204 [Parahypoxylon ruwenzoriense]
MEKNVSSDGELQVSKCHCETGRKRHRIPRSVPIPFETSQPIIAPNQDHESDEESTDDSTISDEIDQDDDVGALEEELLLAGADAMVLNNLPQFNADEWPLVLNNPNNPWVIDDGSDMGSEFSIELEDPAHDPDGAFDDETPPRVATWRLNLTALSQIYNIYMVAYTDKIYVSRPRSCITNALPAEPDLILKPPASEMSIDVGGYLDDTFPHQINHLIVGELGNEEILLLAYDDGDVIGYYTRHIENELFRRESDGRNSGAILEPFFHENVGKSAWGLAVHKQSRIIGVSSNTHNVCVFIFALTGELYRHIPELNSVHLFRILVKDENGNVRNPGIDSTDPAKVPHDDGKYAALENAVRRRDANWRINLETGRGGNNIPNIAFSNDADGEADKVVGVDINGNLWLMDIWDFTTRCPHVKIEALHRNRSRSNRNGHLDHLRRPRGWGVLVLPESSFLPTDNYQDSIGIPLQEVRPASSEKIGHWFDISRGIKYVRDNSVVHPWVRSNQTNRFALNPLEPGRGRSESSWFDFGPEMARIEIADYKPPPERGSSPARKTILGDGSSIMRTYELDIELRSFEEHGLGIMFEKVIDQCRPSHTVLPSMRVSHERLANLIHVPELSLVVAGSLCGRVALVTLTRSKGDNLFFKRAFKIEAILPTKQEEDSQIRPICPLLGVAVAPVPFSGNTELADRPLGRRRYRLMLHYYDLRILSYELSRISTTDHLSII